MANELFGKTIASTFKKLLITKNDDGFENSGAGSERIIATDNGDGNITESCLAVGTARVGIGKTSPDSQLHIGGTNPQIRIGDDGAEDSSLCFMGHAQDYYIALDDTTDDLTIGKGTTIGSSVFMVIESGYGNVGIGTTSPTNELCVGDDIGSISADVVLAIGDTDGDARLVIGDASTDFAQLRWDRVDEQLVLETVVSSTSYPETICLESGRVGIGTSDIASGVSLHIQANQPNIRLSDSNATSTTEVSAIIEWYEANATTRVGYIGFGSTGTTNMDIYNAISSGHLRLFGGAESIASIDIDGNGYVGIGKDPSHPLDVQSLGTSDIGISLTSSVDNNPICFFHEGSSSDGEMYLRDSSNANQVQITAGAADNLFKNGDFGIGVSNALYKLHVVETEPGYTAAFHNDNANGNVIYGKAADDTGDEFLIRLDSDFSGDDTQQFYVKSNGDIYFRGSDVSDFNKKENIEDCEYGLNEVLNIRPREFTFKSDGGESPNIKHGIIAQEIREIMPKAVHGSEYDKNTEKGGLSFDYNAITVALVKSVQELSDKITALENA